MELFLAGLSDWDVEIRQRVADYDPWQQSRRLD
jgi:hypothetical protein